MTKISILGQNLFYGQILIFYSAWRVYVTISKLDASKLRFLRNFRKWSIKNTTKLGNFPLRYDFSRDYRNVDAVPGISISDQNFYFSPTFLLAKI